VVLAEILRRLAVEASNDQDLSAWAFEIRAGKLRDLAVSSWNKSTYRVCGRSMSLQRQAPIVQKFKHYRDRWVRMLDRATHGEDFLASRLPAILRRPLTFMLRTQAVFYEGPYPIYFSGFMKAGRINRHVLRYLSRRGRNDLLQEIASTFSQEQ
jgi:hypothetical protein